jgi:radical SAM superfamily enzyme YgiQ (UPF0313 family)
MQKRDYKILFVSFYNDEACGVRLLHSILYHKGYNAKMLFLKLNSDIASRKKGEHKNALKNTYKLFSAVLTNKEIDIFVNFLINFQPNIVAFSLVSSNFTLYKKIYKRIKDIGIFKIVIGGWQPSLNPEETIGYCDILCVGEGDETLPELVDKLFYNQSIDDIQNLWLKKDGHVIKNGVRPLIMDLSSGPIPVFSNKQSYCVENNELTRKEPYMRNTRYGIISGRGCPYCCSYCSNVYMSKNIYSHKWSKIRYRKVEHVMSELINAKAKLPKLRIINFYDEVFFPDKEWTKEFFHRYKKEIKLPFYCMFYPGTCKEETAKILKESGLDGIWLGIQSGSERVRRDVLKRYYKNVDVLKQVEIFRKYSINIKYDFILDNPFETFEESLETIKLVLEFPQPFSLNLFSLKYFPKTEITKMALREGFKYKSDLEDQRLADEQDSYKIILSQDSSDTNFINHLAAYISFLTPDARLKKEEVINTINNYMTDKDIEPIKKTLSSFLS